MVTTMHSTSRIFLSLVMFAIAACPHWAAAQGPCKVVSPDCVAVGKLDISVSFGAGTRSNPVAGRSNIPLVVIPQVSYYGKRFFLESLEPGVTLYEGDTHVFNVIATPGFDRVFFSRSDPQNIFVASIGSVVGGAGVPGSVGGVENPGSVGGDPQPQEGVEFPAHARRATYLAGPEWLFTYGKLVGQVAALYEVTDRHGGYEMRGAVAVPLIQAKHSLVASAGGTWKSAETVDYYYGVRNFYRPGAALSPFVKLSYSLPLAERWTLSAFVHYEYLGDAIVDSPIVSDPEVVTAFAGFNFKVL
jgi:MipA family protein